MMLQPLTEHGPGISRATRLSHPVRERYKRERTRVGAQLLLEMLEVERSQGYRIAASWKDWVSVPMLAKIGMFTTSPVLSVETESTKMYNGRMPRLSVGADM